MNHGDTKNTEKRRENKKTLKNRTGCQDGQDKNGFHFILTILSSCLSFFLTSLPAPTANTFNYCCNYFLACSP